MKFTLIEGGLGTRGDSARPPNVEAVQAEAARRLQDSGCDAARVRALLTGRPLPPAIAYLQLQIDYAAGVLAGLQPIPADYRSDRYWPSDT